MKLFKIKPLEWRNSFAWSHVLTSIGWLRIHCRKNDRWAFTDEEMVRHEPDYETRDEAKAAAESYYAAEMANWLEPADFADCQEACEVMIEEADAGAVADYLGES